MDNPWITTFSGRLFPVLQATENDVYIEDIAHALSNECRYVGHCKTFYSVAEHSCRLCGLVPKSMRLQALLDDAAEAYLHDMPSLVKQYLFEYRAIEKRLKTVIFSKYRVLPDPSLKTYENKLLAAEVRDLMNINHEGWYLPEPAVQDQIIPWSPQLAEAEFLRLFKELTR